ncbi:MAG: ATP-dependent Clp protease adaptor ClpS [Phycisphaera sp.]|nr:ATP-dependent Clp protease adaptor ClpS [Phycisphaera sp.]
MPTTAEPDTTTVAPPDASTEPPKAKPKPKRKRRTDTDHKPKHQPAYAVVLHNDAINGFDFVVRTLQKVFGYNTARAFWLTLKAHVAGRSHVWTGHKEHAELKRDQVRSCGPDPQMKHRGAGTLRVTIEPLPGG